MVSTINNKNGIAKANSTIDWPLDLCKFWQEQRLPLPEYVCLFDELELVLELELELDLDFDISSLKSLKSAYKASTPQAT